jgi:hypothetical protein
MLMSSRTGVSSVVPGPSLRALQQSYELLLEPRASLAQRRLRLGLREP